jgi:hypothetical protein
LAVVSTQRLNNVDHAKLKVSVGYSAEFGDQVNQAPIFPTEFQEIQREYPILIQKAADGEFQAVALMGLERDENLFLDDSGWHARYIPAMHQRGPFMIGFQSANGGEEAARNPVLHVDLGHPRIGGNDSFPLFLPHGGHAPLLTQIMRVLQTIHEGAEIAGPMFEAFDRLGLIRPANLQLPLSESEQIELVDYYLIDHERFAALDGPALSALHEAGRLSMVIWMLSSLGNFAHLIALKNRKAHGQ